ncbi:MAG: NUDIX domain-containing protein [Candidatus Aenigmatarchaeota archaeon]
MDEDGGIMGVIDEFRGRLPKFQDGRIDYSKSDKAPVITVFVKCKNKILLLKRSNKVNDYQGKWNAVAGYLDKMIPVQEKVLEEIEEELGIEKKWIMSIRIGKPYEIVDSEINKTWIVNPVIVELKEFPNIRLNFEHTEFKWIRKDELVNFDTIPRLKSFFEDYVHMRTIIF